MWLINTSTGRLKWHDSPSEVRYAILSHVWRGEEQTFQELQALMREHDFPREHTSEKIRRCCIYAERDGYEWLWVDACCINKESSAELSEAINSMFMWYAQAGVCYAFLDDVLEGEDPRARGSSFSKSRWWTRGWTLQELIAPRNLVFLAESWAPFTESWAFIGTKVDLAEVVKVISGVDLDILLYKTTLYHVSVARRMFWASRRQTKRVEDRAYSLLGIFNVRLPIIYGEGGNAFIRLQEEIIRTVPDQSIFAWGPVLDDFPLSCGGFFPGGPRQYPGMHGLLALSPDPFVNAAEISPIPIEKLRKATQLLLENPSYSFTSYGCHIEFPIISYRLVPQLSLFRTFHEVPIALLACEDRGSHRLLALLLRRKPNTWKAFYAGHYCITASINPSVHCEVSDIPMANTAPEYHRVVSLVTSLGHVKGLAALQKPYIHTSGRSLELELSRESPRGSNARARKKIMSEEARRHWKLTWQSASMSVIISAAFLPITAYVFATSAKSSRSGRAFLWLAFILFELFRCVVYFGALGRRPLPWLRLQPIPTFVTLRLLNARCDSYVFWALRHFYDMYFLFMPAIVLIGVHYLGW